MPTIGALHVSVNVVGDPAWAPTGERKTPIRFGEVLPPNDGPNVVKATTRAATSLEAKAGSDDD